MMATAYSRVAGAAPSGTHARAPSSGGGSAPSLQARLLSHCRPSLVAGSKQHLAGGGALQLAVQRHSRPAPQHQQQRRCGWLPPRGLLPDLKTQQKL